MQPDPTAPSAWDVVAARNDSLPPGWRRHGQDVHHRLLQRWIGTASGRWLKTDLFEELSPDRALLPTGTASWVGIDLSTAVARDARGRAGKVCVADVRSLPFRDGAFAGVLSTSTLDHFTDVTDIACSLRELHRVLADDAVLVLTLDNASNPLIRLRNALPRSISKRTGLVPFFVGATLDEDGGRRALHAAGFHVDEVTYVLHAPHVIGTRPARWNWYARHVLPLYNRLGNTRAARRTGHYIAFLARRR